MSPLALDSTSISDSLHKTIKLLTNLRLTRRSDEKRDRGACSFSWNVSTTNPIGDNEQEPRVQQERVGQRQGLGMLLL